MNYEKAFNVLAYFADNIFNKRDFNEQERESFSQLAFYFKQIVIFVDRYNSIENKHCKENIAAFRKAALYHNSNFEKSYDYDVLLMSVFGVEELEHPCPTSYQYGE